MAAAHAIVVHRLPGRVRLRIHDRRGDAAYFSQLSESLGRFENVRNARANPVTGSIALEFTGSLEDLVRQALRDDGLAVLESAVADRNARVEAGGNRVATAVPPINLVSGREIDRMFMLGSALLVVALIQTFRGQLFPPAFSVFWYAREAFSLAEGRRRI